MDTCPNEFCIDRKWDKTCAFGRTDSCGIKSKYENAMNSYKVTLALNIVTIIILLLIIIAL